MKCAAHDLEVLVSSPWSCQTWGAWYFCLSCIVPIIFNMRHVTDSSWNHQHFSSINELLQSACANDLIHGPEIHSWKKSYVSKDQVHCFKTVCEFWGITYLELLMFYSYAHLLRQWSLKNNQVIYLHLFAYTTRSTQRAQTSLAKADHYSYIAHCKNVEPWWWKTNPPPPKKKKKKFWIITCTTIWVCYHYYGVFFAHLLILEYPDHHQNLISSSLYYPGPLHKISSQSVYNFLSNVVHRQTDKRTNRQTNATKNITSFAKEVITTNNGAQLHSIISFDWQYACHLFPFR